MSKNNKDRTTRLREGLVCIYIYICISLFISPSFSLRGGYVGERRRQNSLRRSAVVESPDTFRSRPESKKPFQLHLRTNLADSNWYVAAHALAQVYTYAVVRDTRSAARPCVCARVRVLHAGTRLSFSLPPLPPSPPALSPRLSFCLSFLEASPRSG